MKYDGDITYNQIHFQYNGLYVVSPEAIELSPNFGGLNLLKVILIQPPSINSTLVFVPTHSIVISSGIIDNSETSSSISFTSFNSYGFSEIEKINADAFAISALSNSENTSGYIAISVDKNEQYAYSSASTITLDSNAAGTIDITIISNV